MRDKNIEAAVPHYASDICSSSSWPFAAARHWASFVTGRSHEPRGLGQVQMGRALGNIVLHLSKCRITSCLVILLMTPSSMVFGQDPTPGKYSCSIANIVGLQTDSQTGSRFPGNIVPADGLYIQIT